MTKVQPGCSRDDHATKERSVPFFPQRTFDIRLKGVAEVGRAEKSVDSDEQLPDLTGRRAPRKGGWLPLRPQPYSCFVAQPSNMKVHGFGPFI